MREIALHAQALTASRHKSGVRNLAQNVQNNVQNSVQHIVEVTKLASSPQCEKQPGAIMRNLYDAKFETVSAWKSDGYYDQAEFYLSPFWDSGTPFRFLFDKLDTTDVVELACGHGRHVPIYQSVASTITLVDPNEENITFCKNRFADKKFAVKIKYVINTGNELSAIEDTSKTALFCYDAMVHFELLDIHMYLLEIYRILQPGGKALLHHSNTTFNPCAPNSERQGRRNVMSAEIFTHLASRANLTVLQQIILPWGVANLDCLTLLRK